MALNAENAQKVLRDALTNESLFATHRGHKYKAFFILIESMPDVFLTNLEQTEEKVKETLNLTGLFLATILREAKDIETYKNVLNLCTDLLRKFMNESDLFGLSAVLNDVILNLKNFKLSCSGQHYIQFDTVKLHIADNQVRYVFAVLLSCITEFFYCVDWYKNDFECIYERFSENLELIFSENALLESWLRCATQFFTYVSGADYDHLSEHLIKHSIIILKYLSMENRLEKLEDSLVPLLKHLSVAHFLEHSDLEDILEVSLHSPKKLQSVLVSWMQTSMAERPIFGLIFKSRLNQLLQNPSLVLSLIDYIDITTEDLTNMTLDNSTIEIFLSLIKKPKLWSCLRIKSESFLRNIRSRDIVSLTDYHLSVKVCRLLIESRGNLDHQVFSLIFAPLLTNVPSAAYFVREQQRIKISPQQLGSNHEIITECFSLIPLLPEARVNHETRKKILNEALSHIDTVAPALRNLQSFKDTQDAILKFSSSDINLSENALDALSSMLTDICCTIYQNVNKTKKCPCLEANIRRIKPELSFALIKLLLKIVPQKSVPLQRKCDALSSFARHLDPSQETFDILMNVFLEETNYSLRLALVSAVFEFLKHSPNISPRLDFDGGLLDNDNIEIFEPGLMLISRVCLTRPKMRTNLVSHLIRACCCDVPILREIGVSEIRWYRLEAQLTPKDAMFQFRQVISNVVYQKIVRETERSILSILQGVSEAFDPDAGGEVWPCLNLLHRYLLPLLISNGSMDAFKRLREIAKLSVGFAANEKNTQNKLILLTHKYLPQIFAYLFFSQKEQAPIKCQKYLEFLLDRDWKRSFTDGGSDHKILFQLMTYLHRDEDAVKAGISFLASIKGKSVTTDEQVRSYVCKHQTDILGVLFLYDSNIRTATAEDREATVNSLAEFIRYIGFQQVTKLRIKLMYILRLASSVTEGDCALQSKCAAAWSLFVKSLDKTGLSNIVGDLVMSIIPLLNTKELFVQAKEILEYLLVVNKACYVNKLIDLSFLQEMEVLPTAIRKQLSIGVNSDFMSEIRSCMRNLTNENNNAKKLVLKRISRLMSSDQKSLYKLIDNDTDPDFIGEIIQLLFACCQTSDLIIHSLVGECLSHIGAIDPARVVLKSNVKDCCPLNISESNKFAHGLLKRIVNTFLTSTHEHEMQNKASFAIQELSKIYCLPESKELWTLFTDHEKEVIRLLLDTRYSHNASENPQISHPIFTNSNSFMEWINKWIRWLLTLVPDNTTRSILEISSLISEHDTSVAQYILPSVVATVMETANDDQMNIMKTEVVSILDGCVMGTKSKEFLHMATQTVFNLIAHLISAAKSLSASRDRVGKDSRFNYYNDKRFTFADQIDQNKLARAAFACQEYSRALMHISRHLRQHPKQLQENLKFLQDIYVGLNDPDNVAGAAALRVQDATLTEKVLEHRATGKLLDAFTCYERLTSHGAADNKDAHIGILECLLALDQPLSALTHANGLMQGTSFQETCNEWNSYRIEAAWKLGDWSALDEYLRVDTSSQIPPFGSSVGSILSSAYHRNKSTFEERLKIARQHEMMPASASCLQPEIYLQLYPTSIIRLHMLNDLEVAVRNLIGFDSDSIIPIESRVNELVEIWKRRDLLLKPEAIISEHVLKMRRTILKLATATTNDVSAQLRLNTEICKCWLRSAQLAREEGHYQHAYSCVLEAKKLGHLPEELCLEQAMLSWMKGEQINAIRTLEKFIELHDEDQNMQPRSKAKIRLLHANYCKLASSVDHEALQDLFKRASKSDPNWEDPYYFLAKYYDDIYLGQDINLTDQISRIDHILRFYVSSLFYGDDHLYHSLPRLLTIYFDLGKQLAEQPKNKFTDEKKNRFDVVTTRLRDNLRKLKPELLYAVLAQLVSRICHPQEMVRKVIYENVIRLIHKFPKQTLWHLMFATRSANAERRDTADRILEASGKSEFIKPLRAFIEHSLRLCSMSRPKKEKEMSLRSTMAGLYKDFNSMAFKDVLIPGQTALDVSNLHATSTHVTVCGIEDKVVLLASLVRPKKVTIRGSDGKSYNFLLKAEDDLRKDCRLMELTGLINRFLKLDPEANSRKLSIRNYNVTPISDTCGIIEWVENLIPMGHAIKDALSLSPNVNQIPPNTLLMKYAQQHEIYRKQAKEIDAFLNLFNSTLAEFKPSMPYWFLNKFPDAPSWYQAQTLFASSAAVMSIVGFVLGLGDRHCENILVDCVTGRAVHVDFNCIFLRGELLPVPELVPFRLTQNMIEAMGPTGYQGTFRKSCEITLKVIRKQSAALMSVLNTFIHDPLVEWTSHNKGQQASGKGNVAGLQELQEIEYRINGVFEARGKPASKQALSMQGQVSQLIAKAVDHKNLCRMFPGWQPWM